MASTETTSASTVSPTPPPAIDHQETFQVHFPPDKTFTLTSTMLQHDSPSMFSRVFLSPSYSHFRESHSRTITIPDKSPDLFPFILDYLRGYTFFPLVEAAVPAHWLPLSKTYDNLRRDAAYYGLLRLEAECLKWWRQTLDPEDRQCALRLDFVPFTPGQSILRGHPLTAEMALDVHLADVHLLRKRFMKPGGKTLTYGPFPWKQIFEQIRDPCDRDGPLQSDGSAIVELNSTFLKPPREITGSTADADEDDRKIEFAKVHISKAITQLILHNVKPGGLNNHITLRFHTTSATTLLHFSTPDCPASTPIARAQFLFSDKVQSEGYFNLRSTVKHENLLDDPNSWPHMSAEKVTFAMDVDGDVALQVDGGKVVWRELCEWSRVHSMFYSETSSREVLELEQGDVVNRRTHAIFGGNREPTTGAAIASVFGNAVFIFARTKFDTFLAPQILSIRGSSSGEWERQRPVWQGDHKREQYAHAEPATKRARKNKAGAAVVRQEDNVLVEEGLGE